jgi:hypothetical protein
MYILVFIVFLFYAVQFVQRMLAARVAVQMPNLELGSLRKFGTPFGEFEYV